ncbi:MAG: response regulator, partial [Elusimicrobiota bacterium]|nr:response regulator [Elusimicrobiota bacterium]
LDAEHQVETALNGREAIEKLSSFVPDIMIVDIVMPEMDGSAFIENLNKLSQSKPELKNIPFIVMTGENFISSNYPGFHNNPCCKLYVPKMTMPEEVLAEAETILRDRAF